jgi:branched-chain amino acid transport system ATP-binding protein
MSLIETSGLSAGYGRMEVVRDLDIQVAEGEIVALVGPNGAGKTTLLLTLAGELPPIKGVVTVLGNSAREPMHARCRRGLGFVTEERSVIRGLTAADNLKVAGVSVKSALELFPELEKVLNRKAGLLSGGEQQMLTLARALGRNPRALLVDELSLGLAPIIVSRLLQRLRSVVEQSGVGVLLVEQHISQALKVADRVYVMQKGRIVMSGQGDELTSRLNEIERAYLE